MFELEKNLGLKANVISMYKSRFQSEGFFRPRIAENVTISGTLKEHTVEIYSSDFRFDKIFIRKQGLDENAIVGVAALKNGSDTNEFYRVYEVTACRQTDYDLYLATFKETYKEQKLYMNKYAMDGAIFFV